MKFPTGGITVLLSSSSTSSSAVVAADNLLEDIHQALTAQGHSETPDQHSGRINRVVKLFCQPVTQGSTAQLRHHVLYHTGKERPLPLPAGTPQYTRNPISLPLPTLTELLLFLQADWLACFREYLSHSASRY